MDPERRVVLERLVDLLTKFGIANDAQDHNCRPEAEQLRHDAAAGIRELMAQHPFIAVSYPGLGPAPESRSIESCSWSTIVDAIEPTLGREQRYPYWTVLRIKAGDGAPEYCGSKEVAPFPSLEEARAHLGTAQRQQGEALMIVEVRAKWEYYMPDGRSFAPQMGMPLRGYLSR